MTTDKFCVEITELRGMLKDARKIKISFFIPEIFKTIYADVKAVHLSIRDENNDAIDGWIKTTIVRGQDKKDLLTEVHKSKLVDFYKNPQEVDFEFIAQEKLPPGIYTAKMYTVDEYLGSVDFKVRKRFWFF
ncbi:hypothetical protein [Emticicia sp. C21]|uniref:hypothetical protein n=1 Tax=Emticicia sp. C21 TaxID=2302915 RepID=UPI000E34985D|nr:hypothetical protein [Emticicia sp. C21]RFS15545.1 hypothetical protein D0T08_15455 [Emticicia sp. C21]